MPKSILRLSALSILCAAGAFGQVRGSFGQITYGGGWQTTFTLINMSSSSPATVILAFYGDDGAPLNAPIQNAGSNTSYALTIPASATQNVVLTSSNPNPTQGWATMSTTGTVRGQGSFRFQLPGGTISEAVVPLSVSGSALCIIPFPQSDPVILVPFDNTSGQYLTSIAIANTTNAPLTVQIEFDDQANNQLATDTLNLTAMQHMAFLTTQNYPALKGQKGLLRIHEGTDKVTVLGLLSNATNAITTIMPVTQ